MKHELKTINPFFTDSINGKKLWEIRLNDRSYKLGDEVILREYNPSNNSYSGRRITGIITYIFRADDYPNLGLDENYVIFGYDRL